MTKTSRDKLNSQEILLEVMGLGVEKYKSISQLRRFF